MQEYCYCVDFRSAYDKVVVATFVPEKQDFLQHEHNGVLEMISLQGNVEDLAKIDAQFIEQQKKIMPEPERFQEFCTNYMKS